MLVICLSQCNNWESTYIKVVVQLVQCNVILQMHLMCVYMANTYMHVMFMIANVPWHDTDNQFKIVKAITTKTSLST